MKGFHEPVMLAEVLENLNPQSGQVIADCTVGGGGHALEIVKRVLPDGRLIGIDRDLDAVKTAGKTLEEYAGNVILGKGDFACIRSIAEELGFEFVDGVLMDLGVSSHQLDSPTRGFAFKQDSPLDMRMDRSQAETVADVVNTFSVRRLAEIIGEYGEERWAKRIAKFIVERREQRPIRTTGELVDVVLAAMPTGARPRDIHPATRTFQAFRILVNRELESLQQGLDESIGLLKSGGRICVLSYHSLEDRIVKQAFARHAGKCVCPSGFPVCACGAHKSVSVLTKRPSVPSRREVEVNPRARSAKLRAAEKL